MGCGQEGFRAPEGSQGQRTPVFDTIETALDEIAGFVERKKNTGPSSCGFYGAGYRLWPCIRATIHAGDPHHTRDRQSRLRRCEQPAQGIVLRGKYPLRCPLKQ